MIVGGVPALVASSFNYGFEYQCISSMAKLLRSPDIHRNANDGTSKLVIEYFLI